MSLRTERELLPLYQDENGCSAAVCAQIAWLLDGERLGLDDVSEQMRRIPGERVEENAELVWLLERGYSVSYRSTFDEAALAKRGIEYALEFYGDEQRVHDFYTPEKLSEIAIQRAVGEKALKPYRVNGHYTQEAKATTFEDIDLTLSLHGIVHARLYNGDHSIAIYDKKHAQGKTEYWVYDPVTNAYPDPLFNTGFSSAAELEEDGVRVHPTIHILAPSS